MNLARLLLEYERTAADQVPLLLRLGDEQRGLQCAIESGDTDLVYFTIFHLYRKLALVDQLHEFSNTILSEGRHWISSSSTARQRCSPMLRLSSGSRKRLRAALQNPDTGKEMYRQIGLSEGEAGMVFDSALAISLEIPDDASGEDDITVGNMREQVVNLLKEAAVVFVRVDLSLPARISDRPVCFQSKKHDFQAKSCEEFAQLRKMQVHVDQNMGRNVLVGLGVVDSIKQCIRLDNQKAAYDFKRSFGVSDKSAA